MGGGRSTGTSASTWPVWAEVRFGRPYTDSWCSGGSPRVVTTMVKFWEHLQPEHIDWIAAQKLFWVATSPLSPDGHINVSPKGVAGTFHITNERKVWYEDLTGSGAHNPFVPTPRLTARLQESRQSLTYARTVGLLSCLPPSTALRR